MSCGLRLVWAVALGFFWSMQIPYWFVVREILNENRGNLKQSLSSGCKIGHDLTLKNEGKTKYWLSLFCLCWMIQDTWRQKRGAICDKISPLSTSTKTLGKADVSDIFQVPEPDKTFGFEVEYFNSFNLGVCLLGYCMQTCGWSNLLCFGLRLNQFTW